MANYLGYGLKAGVEGFKSGFNMGQMKWQQNEKKKLQKKQDEMMEAASVFNTMVAQLGEDGSYSDDDMMKINTSYMALGYDVKERVDGTYKAIQAMDKKTVEENYKWFDYVIEATEDMKSGDAQSIFDTIRPFVSGEKGLQMYEGLESITKKKSEIAPKAEVFSTAAAVKEAYPEAGVRYTDEGYVPIIGEPTADKAPSATDAKLNFAISSYNAGKISFDELSKYMGTYIAPEKMSAKREEIELAKQYGATNEEIKNKLLGKPAGTLTPTPTSVESLREDIKNAPTLEDAKRIEKNHIAKYGDTLGIPNVDKFWSDERVKRLTSLKQGIDKLLDEKKRLKKGTVTSADVGFEIEDDIQKVEAVYRQLREEYMKYRNMLEKMGVDLSQFPELMSYEEYLKADIKPGMGIFYPSTWGKQKPTVY